MSALVIGLFGVALGILIGALTSVLTIRSYFRRLK